LNNNVRFSLIEKFYIFPLCETLIFPKSAIIASDYLRIEIKQICLFRFYIIDELTLAGKPEK